MQDMDQAGIALVELSSGLAKQEEQQHNWAALDEERFRSHPGLTVLQIAWHPGAEELDCLHNSQRIPCGHSSCATLLLEVGSSVCHSIRKADAARGAALAILPLVSCTPLGSNS